MRDLLPDTVKLTGATVIMLAGGALFALIPLPEIHNPRAMALLQLGKIALGCLLATWPALLLTKSITAAEGNAIVNVLVPRRFRPGYVTVER